MYYYNIEDDGELYWGLYSLGSHLVRSFFESSFIFKDIPSFIFYDFVFMLKKKRKRKKKNKKD